MTPAQFEQMNRLIEETIRTTVNGKIDRMNQKLEDYIVTDNEWKKVAQKSISLIENVTSFGKVSLYLSGFISAVVGSIILINNIFKR